MGVRAVLFASIAVAASACSGGGGNSPPPPTNGAPVFSSPATSAAPENTASAFYTAAATDPEGAAVTFSLSGGADQTRFAITNAGALSFASPPDFENPGDSNGDNVYDVTIRASDGVGTASLNLRVTVTDVTEPFRVRRIASGLSQPLFLLGRGDGTNRVFIVEKGGQVEILNLATGLLNPTPFLDLTTSINSSGEQGLLGMALAPDFATSGVFYVHLNNLAGDTEIRRYRLQAANPDLADLSTADIILTADQPAATNHKGGWIGFGPGNLLYIALGDGGGSNDPFGNGQNRNTLLGAMLRIDPSSDGFPADPLRDYAIPASNPFAAGGGAPEILAFGLRNPFRASFDRTTNNLFIGDVGQGAIEEIDLIRPTDTGLNFGWPILEGTRVNQPGSTAGMTPPVAEYAHGAGPREGNSVTGGYVYRGPVEALEGQYVFADFITANVWSFAASAAAQGTTIPSSAFAIQTGAFAPDIGTLNNVASFGEDDAGNLFIIGVDGEIFRLERL